MSGLFPNSDMNFAQLQFDLDYERPDSIHTIKYSSGLIGFSMMQKIGKNLSLGFDYSNFVINFN